MKPTNGKLVYIDNAGKEHVLLNDKPFALLNQYKSRIKDAYIRNSLKIKYL